ncbi:MAG: Gfo/Idh/MocA family oxidoreductase [Desulfobacteraceae bacterium]|nr:Gfo/Idh/MocA family oxidoreductase [Desulfobacteraceae bacterium]MBC2749206.1 Gfo/Idh/MocA family oxidoreductase [Desulfobacteraceae bacterium]
MQNAIKNAKTIRVGIAGLGGIAKRTHIPILKLVPGYQVVAGAERDDIQRERVAKMYNIPKVYSDFHEMIKSADIDAVFICLPATLHLQAVTLALECGLHVFCEKPMGLHAKDTAAMIEAAEKAEKVLMPGYNIRHVANFRKAKRLLESKKLGHIIHVNALFMNPGPYISWDPKSDWYLEANSGGALYDIGSHIVDLLFYIYPHRLKNLTAYANQGYKPYDATTNVVCSYHTDNSLLGTIQVGWRSASEVCSLEFHGTAGTLLVSRRNFSYTHGATDPADRIAISATNILQELKSVVGKLNLIRKGADVLDEFNRQALYFKRLVKNNRSNVSELKSAMHVHEVLDGIGRSIETGKMIEL